jgi:hypothetical protein
LTRLYEPDLSVDLDSLFARDAANKLVRRSYWMDMDDRTLVMVVVNGIGAHLTNDEKRAHLTDLRRERLVDQVCIQEILPPERQLDATICVIFATTINFYRLRPSTAIFKQYWLRLCAHRDRLPSLRFSQSVSGREMGYLMKSGIATHSLPDEHFVLQMDGRVKSQHRRFVDALRAGLQLRDQFPHHDIKVRAAEIMQETVFH